MAYLTSQTMALAGATFQNISNYSDAAQEEGGGDGGGGGDGEEVDPYAAAIPFVIGMLSVFSVIGTIGNALVLYIFTKMLKQKLTSTVFILTLAGTDFVTCLITIPTTIAMEYYGYKFPYDIPCKIYHALITTTVPYSSVIMVGIAIDRYLCICHPFLRAMNIKRARWMVIGLAVMTFSLGITISLFYGVYSNVSTETNYTTTLQPGNSSFPYGDTYNLSSLMSLYDNESDGVFSTDLRENVTELRTVTEVKFSGMCDISNIIFSDKTFFRSLQYIHASIFAITVFVVSFLYILIFHRILANTAKMRKKRRQGTSGWSCGDCCSRKLHVKAKEETQLAPMNGDVKNSGDMVSAEATEQNGTNVASPQRPLTQRRNSKKSDKALMANLKIAGTLFVVCLVFFVAFLPAWLMALKFIPFKIRLFYCYFVYNIANPVIYAFMNQTFRQQLKELFCNRKQSLKSRRKF